MEISNLPSGRLCKKTISIIVAISFIFSNIAFADIQKTTTPDIKKDAQVTTDPEKIVIPRDYGLIKAKYTGKNSRKLVIHIQDAHCNYEAQSNIIKILECLIKNDSLSLVSVEGADGFIDTSWFKAFPDADIRKEVADYFMKKGEITGPEFISITTNYPIRLFGAETRSYYIENLNAFTSSYPLKEDTEKYFNQIKTILNKLKNYIYSEDLKTLDAKAQDYESKKLQFTDYVKFLEALAINNKINLRQYENLFKLVSVLVYEKKINFEVVDKERSALIDDLTKKLSKDILTELVTRSLAFKTGKLSSAEYYDYLRALAQHNGFELSKDYPNLFNYIIYNSVYSRIENEKLFKDIKDLEIAIKEKIFKNDDQRTLEKLYRHIEILSGLVNIKLLNGDFDYYKLHREEFSHEVFADFIKKMTAKYGFAFELDAPSDAIKENLPKLEDFYAIAVKRDKALLDNTLQAMDKENTQICVLVTGGFHSEGITKMMEKQGISYMVVCPNITKDVETPYIKILTNQRTPLEDILADTGATEPKSTKSSMLAPFLITAGIDHGAVNGLVQARTDGDREAWLSDTVALWFNKIREIATEKKIQLTADLAIAVFARDVDAAVAQYEKSYAELRQHVDKANLTKKAVAIKAAAPAIIARLLATPAAPAETVSATPRGERYSSPEKFMAATGQDMSALMEAAPELEGMKDAYNAWVAKEIVPLESRFAAMQKQYAVETSDAEKVKLESEMDSLRDKIDSLKKAKADEIDNIIRRKYNAKLMEREAGFTDSDISDSSIKRDLPTTGAFRKSEQYANYRETARNLAFNGSVAKIDLLGGAASRLFGEGQNVDPSLSYATHDVYDVAQSRRYPKDKLQGARLGINMFARIIIQEWIFIENELNQAYKNLSPEQIAQKRREIIWNTPRIVVINNESGEAILKEFVANKHYGHNPDLVVFVMQDAFKGSDVKDGRPVIADKSRPLPVGHGDSTMQISQAGRSFTIDKDGDVKSIQESADEYLNKVTKGRTKIYVESRVNDMLKLGYSANGESAEEIGKVDMDVFALALSQMGDLDSMSDGKNVILEQLVPDPRIKGSSPMHVHGRDFSIETLAHSDKVKQVIGSATAAPFNRFCIFYKRGMFRLLREQGLPVHIRFRDGLFYPEIVTSDLTLLEGAHAGYVMDDKRKITDYKDGKKTLEIGVNAALRQDSDPRFLADLVELAPGGGKNVTLKGLEKAPSFGHKQAQPSVGAIRANGGELTTAEHGARTYGIAEGSRMSLGENTANGIIREKILAGQAYFLIGYNYKVDAKDEIIKTDVPNIAADNGLAQENYRRIISAMHIQNYGISLVVIKGLEEELIKRGIAPDLILHPGITRGAAYIDEGDLAYLLSLPNGAGLVLEAIGHEKAHIDNPDKSEAEIEKIAPSTNVRKTMFTRAATAAATAGNSNDAGQIIDMAGPISTDNALTRALFSFTGREPFLNNVKESIAAKLGVKVDALIGGRLIYYDNAVSWVVNYSGSKESGQYAIVNLKTQEVINSVHGMPNVQQVLEIISQSPSQSGVSAMPTDINKVLTRLSQWNEWAAESSRTFFALAELTMSKINELRKTDPRTANNMKNQLDAILDEKIDLTKNDRKIWTKPADVLNAQAWLATRQISGLVPNVPMADMTKCRSDSEIDEILAAKPVQVAYQRGSDAGGSSIDLPTLQTELNKLGVTWLDDITSTTILPSNFRVRLQVEKASSKDVIEYVIRQNVIDKTTGKITQVEKTHTVKKGDLKFDKNGNLAGGMMDAFAYIMGERCGKWGVKATFETVDAISEVGGFGRSGASMVMFLRAASMVKGIELSKASIQAESIFLENEILGGLTGGQEAASTLSGKPIQMTWLEYVRDEFGRSQFPGGSGLLFPVFDEVTGKTPDEMDRFISDRIRFVQPGLDYKEGKPADARTAAAINTIWTWLALDHDEVAFPLHQEKTFLANLAYYGLRTGHMNWVIYALNRHRVIRNLIDRRGIELALMNLASPDTPKYAAKYKEFFENNPVLKEYMRRFNEQGIGPRTQSLYSLTAEPFIKKIEAFVDKKYGRKISANDKEFPIGIFLPGAGGPGTNVMIVTKTAGEMNELISYIGMLFFSDEPMPGKSTVTSSQVIETVRGTGKLQGVAAFKTGGPVEDKNWPTFVKKPAGAIDVRYDQRTGKALVSPEDYPALSHLPGVAIDAEKVKAGQNVAVPETHPATVSEAQSYDMQVQEGRTLEFRVGRERSVVRIVKISENGVKLAVEGAEAQKYYLSGEQLVTPVKAVITVTNIFPNVEAGRNKKAMLNVSVEAGIFVMPGVYVAPTAQPAAEEKEPIIVGATGGTNAGIGPVGEFPISKRVEEIVNAEVAKAVRPIPPEIIVKMKVELTALETTINSIVLSNIERKPIVIAHDTGLDLETTVVAQAAESYLEEYYGGKLIIARGSGVKLAEQIDIARQRLNDTNTVVVTIAGNDTLNAITTAAQRDNKDLKDVVGTVLNVQINQEEPYVPFAILYNLAFRIAYNQIDDNTISLLNAFLGYVTSDNQIIPFTIDQLRQGIIRILPRAGRINAEEAREAYKAAAAALRSL